MFNQILSTKKRFPGFLKRAFIPVCFVFSPLLGFSQQVPDTHVFPDAWLGVWDGELLIYNGQEIVQKVKMKIENLPTDTVDVYTWALYYGEDTLAGKRDYLLRPMDKMKGLWEIDERNSIFLDGRVVANKFISVFSVMKNTLTSIVTIEEQNTMIFEIFVHHTESHRQTGNTDFEGENIPMVMNYSVTGYQRATLKKRN